MRKTVDAIFDIIILAIYVFTIILIVDDVVMRYLLTIVGCGAMFNNFKYLYDKKKLEKKSGNDNQNNNPKK